MLRMLENILRQPHPLRCRTYARKFLGSALCELVHAQRLGKRVDFVDTLIPQPVRAAEAVRILYRHLCVAEDFSC